MHIYIYSPQCEPLSSCLFVRWVHMHPSPRNTINKWKQVRLHFLLLYKHKVSFACRTSFQVPSSPEKHTLVNIDLILKFWTCQWQTEELRKSNVHHSWTFLQPNPRSLRSFTSLPCSSMSTQIRLYWRASLIPLISALFSTRDPQDFTFGSSIPPQKSFITQHN